MQRCLLRCTAAGDSCVGFRRTTCDNNKPCCQLFSGDQTSGYVAPIPNYFVKTGTGTSGSTYASSALGRATVATVLTPESSFSKTSPDLSKLVIDGIELGRGSALPLDCEGTANMLDGCAPAEVDSQVSAGDLELSEAVEDCADVAGLLDGCTNLDNVIEGADPNTSACNCPTCDRDGVSVGVFVGCIIVAIIVTAIVTGVLVRAVFAKKDKPGTVAIGGKSMSFSHLNTATRAPSMTFKREDVNQASSVA